MTLEIFERDQTTDKWCMGQNCRVAGARGTTVVIDTETDALYYFCPDCAEPWGADQGIGPKVYDALSQPYPPELQNRLRSARIQEEQQKREAEEEARQRKMMKRAPAPPQPPQKPMSKPGQKGPALEPKWVEQEVDKLSR